MQEQLCKHKLLHMSGVAATASAKSGTLTICNFKKPSSFVLDVLLLTLSHCKGVLLTQPPVKLFLFHSCMVLGSNSFKQVQIGELSELQLAKTPHIP
jgi:hypothetical protein